MATTRPARRHPKNSTKIAPLPEAKLNPVVSVIVLHYNTLKLTLACVKSIMAQLAAPAYEIIVVDNASTDGSGIKLASQLRGQARVIRTKRNLGFGAGNNYGATFSRGRYLFFVNSDTILSPTLLGDMAAVADHHPEFGLLSPRVLLPNKRKMVQPASFGRFASVWRMLTRSVDLPASYLDGADQLAPCDWVTGAAIWLPAEVWLTVGGFDSRYFMYWEDQDLCRSIHLAGWQVGVAVDATIIHLGGRSTRLPQGRWAHYDQSQRAFILKHQGLLAFGLFMLLAWPWKRWRRR